MKNFFKNLFKKTYPERVNEDQAKTKIVYAGPPKGLSRKKRMMCVYAGPGMMGRMRQRADSEMEDVYAGPPTPDEIDEPDDVYDEPDNLSDDHQNSQDGPDPVRDLPEMRAVYAGPEQMADNKCIT